MYRVLDEIQDTLVEALEHGRDDLVDLADDFLARCHCEGVLWGMRLSRIQIDKNQVKRG